MLWARCCTLSLWMLVAATALHAGEPLARYSFSEPHMGTQFKILLYAPDRATAEQAAQAAFARIAVLDGIMSDYRATSELMRLCRQAGGPPVPVSPELFFVLSRSQELARQTHGAFDVTVGPVVRLWRRARRNLLLPDPDELAKARALVGFDKVRLEPSTRTVQLTQPGMQLDLGGIAKGYAADEALKALQQLRISRALIAAGGDIVAGEAPPGAEGWTVGIAPLEDPEKPPKRYLRLRYAAVSTSGDTEQYVEIAGKRYSHIVDPRTGLGLTVRSSVTVLARDGTTADSLATALSVLGPERGLELIEQTEGTAALIVRKTERVEEKLVSKRFPDEGTPK